MQPSPELVALAKRFHELGGTEGEQYGMIHRWVFPCHNSKLYYIDDVEGEAWAEENNVAPFLTESELWEWLRKNHRDFTIDAGVGGDESRLCLYEGSDGPHGMRVWNPYKVFKLDKGLWYALYAAAVWVAEREK